MAVKYQRYRNRCCEMRERLRAGASTQSARKELEKSDEDLMRSIRRCSELEELLHAKNEEIEVGKGITAECEDLQAKVLSIRAELEQNAARVDALSAEWVEKVVELEKKVAELEQAEDGRVPTLARAAALEDTIPILKSEQESERATTTMREVRLEERIGKIDREASNFGDRVVTLEAEKAQLLAQVHAEAQQDIYKGLWEAGIVPEAAFKDAQAKSREARVADGYDPATPEVGKDTNVDGFPDDNDGENNGGDDAE
ncbi:uncharacterized protein [Nicotiana sylvestris]|uniref:uncharacterized protein n=1 Tax=Nicotiana sylvestris TaxID=4096 RepID=UPI00388CBAB7